MDNICCACKRTFPSLKGLHLHVVRKEKIGLDDYYKIYFPRQDYLTNEPIDFKNHEQYFSSYFNSKENMALWFQSNWSLGKAKDLAQTIIQNRVELKGLKNAPSQLELRTVNCPSVTFCQKMFNYNEFCQKLELKTRFKYGIVDTNPYQEIKVLIDTREQYPLEFKNSQVKKLDVGDYTAAEPHYADIYVERKSVQDFYGTFFNPTNLERFEKEISRAKSYGFYLVVVVENNLNNCLAYKSSFIREKHFVVLTFHNVRNLMQKYDNLQFAFSHSRLTAAQLTTRIFNQKEKARDFDWQYLIDSKQI